MNRNKLLLIALIFTLGIFSSLFAQVDITIGDGTATNTTTGAPAPYGTWYKNFHQQYLYRVGDIEEAGGGAGPINSLAFNVASVNNCSPMPNFTISLKTTTQTELTTNFEEGEYTQVFYQNDFMPIDGMNVHTFIAPFVWDGASNIIVDIITDLIPGSYTQNASVYYTVTDVNTSLRYQNDSLPASGSTTGSTSTSRANITFNMSAVQVTDPPNPALLVGPEDGSTLSSPLVTLNWTSGGGIPHGYKLYFGSSADPAYVGDLEAATTYTPTGLEFDTTYYWKVIPYNTAGDAVNCPVWSFTTMPSPVISTFPWIVDFGTETTDWPVPNWSQRGGLYPEASETSTQWYRDDWLNISGASNNAAKTNIYGTIRKGWLITPPLDIPGNDYELKFDLALTDYANSNPIEDPTAQLDDKFIVAISDNPDMSNPTLLREWNNSGSEFVYNQIPHTGMEITLFLTGMSGIKYIAFYGESTESGGDNDLFVDNVQVRQTPSTPLFTVTPSEYDFGQLLLGTSATKQFRVTNSGVGELIISSINLPANDNFTLANMPALPVVLNVGESVVFDAVYTPVAEGAHTANISITDNLARVVHNVPLSGSGFDATIYTLPYAQTWDEVETPNLPLGWSSYVEATTTYAVVSTSTSSPNSTPNCVYMYNSSDADAQLMLISPPFDSAIAMNSIRAYIMAKGGTGYTMQVGTMSNPSNPESFSLIEEITVPSGWNQYVVNLTGHTPAGQFIAIKHDVGSTYHSLYIDDVSFELIAPNDLAALSVSGETMIPANTPATFAVSVYNNGTATQNAYEVKLFDVYHTELASVAGPTIDPGATIDVNLTWTPTVEGLSGIYGKVLLAGDVNPANDVSPSLNIFVSSADLFTVEIGEGTNTNTNTGVPTPYGTFYKNFRQQYLVLASELNDAGGGAGPINAIGFNVESLNTCSPMPNYRIRLKSTEQTELSTTFEVGEYTEVFQAAEYMPVLGWNTHTFSNAFVWDGASNLIIEVVTDLIPGSYTQNASVYYTTTGFNSSLRAQSDSSPAIDATSGTISTSRSNMRLVMMALDIIDMNALTITGPSTPSVNSETEYTVTVKNYSPNNVDEYTVKLMQEGGIELASVPGTLIEQHQTLSFTLPWTPSVVGETHLYGKVVMAGDENPENDETNILTVNVMEAGLSVAEIGTGTDTNTNTGVPTPYGTFYKNFRQQYLYTADEIYAAGGVPGLINALAFNVADVGGCSPMPNYRIRVKHTTQEALTTTFEEGEYTQVFHAEEFLPTNEWNVHTFSTPFFWNGGDNLLVDIVSDLVAEYTRNALVYYTPTSFSSALRYQSDSSPADAATTGTLYSNRSNIRFFLLVDDMGSLSGTVTENGVPLANVHIQVEDTVFSTTSGANGVYTLPHVPIGTQTVTATKHGFTPVSHTVTIALDQQTVQDFEMVGTPEISISPNSWSFGDVNLGGSANKEFSIANAGGGLLEITDISISGSTTFALGNLPGLPASLGSEQELNFTVTFTPNAMGETNAEIIITDNLATRHVFSLNQQVTPAKSSIDSRSTRNENRTVHTIQLNGYGVNELTIGTGEEEGYYPINFYYNNSLFETIYTAEEMNNFIGMITGIKFYTNFNTELMDKPVKIWLGSTALTNLSAGWIPSTDLTLVFDGNVSYPAGESIVSYTFPEPYMHLDGGNLVMLVQRPMDTGWVSGKYFKIQTVGTDRSLNIQNDSVELDPANPSDGTLSGNFPKTTFSIIPGGVGHVTGTVIDENAAPLPGVQVLINGRNSRAVTDENGQFYIANILPGDYVVSFSRYGYIDQDINIVLEEDETEVLDVTMQPMPKVIVSGTVLASDTGVGIAGANIQLEGYADYAFTTNASGVFQSEAEVYANFTYEYQIAAAGYVSTSGSIEVGDTDYSMGDIVLAEIAYAPTEVTASLNDSFDGIDIEWSAPDPNAIEITQSFEDATFPPSGWSQQITNNSPANSHGVRPTWGRLGTINDGIPAVPTDGTYQAGLCWIMEHQDEWLITNSFNCPPDAYLSFDTYLEMGSPNGDHYYVKASIDGGVTWTELWDGAAQTAANNYYTTPIHIDLVSFNGQHIKLAFHADDPPDELGLWKNWYIDNIYIGNYMEAKQITNLDIVSDTGKTKSAEIKPECSTPILHSEANMRTESRALVGYKIWRLLTGQEQSEETWIALNDEATSNTSYTDDNWNELENGTYRWAVKSVYTSDVMSSAAFSNSIIKDAQMGNIVGFVRGADNAPLAGATVSAGTGQSTTTNSSGYYILSLSAGSYTLTATATDYHPLSYDNIPVIANQNTTRNFQLVHTSNNDEMVPVTVTALNGNYPNPFNPETTISYDLKEAAPVQLDIFNLKGQLVRTLVNENQAAGRYRIVFDAKDFRGNRLSSGVYFYRMRTGSYINTRKMLLME